MAPRGRVPGSQPWRPRPAAVFASFRFPGGSRTASRPPGKGGVPWGNRAGLAPAVRSGVGARVPGAATPGCWGAGPSRGLGRLEQQRLKRCVRTTGANCGLGPVALPTWKPRPGRAARGFHGDGKQASTASSATAKSPAFHPPLGVQRDDGGAGCEVERERGRLGA